MDVLGEKVVMNDFVFVFLIETKHMKRTIFLVLGIVFMLSACSKNKALEKEIEQIEDAVLLGDWTISKMIDSGDDETSNFQGYIFTFKEDGSLVATNNATTYNGTWSITKSSSSDDDSNDSDIDFNITFNVSESNDFDDLIDDWDVLTHSDYKIELQDISGGNGGADLLTFTR